ncbi:synaptonemal complex protein 1-like isoform X2 [Pseudomyrmex gracilis]|uniref:synaptonemal complex protein 1-like isoform X2 n=1 Tax=Pseudomyrmex gracilis TaxID=219809 RepID=UPI0009954AE3|nr:synaptonemal complex protein 1-like isoform X2 [Pseudomyrmex gracilis]
MEEAHTNTQTGGKFIDTFIAQWMKRTENNISLHQTEEVQESSSQNVLRDENRVIQDLRRKLSESQQMKTSLSASLEVEMRHREEIQTSESLATFQQHRANLSGLYDNVILKQQEAIKKLQSDRDNHIAQLKHNARHEERLQEAITEQNKLRKQLENYERERASQQKELANTHAEKLAHIRELEQLSVKHANLQSRLQSVEKEKCDIKDLVTQLENKLLMQEETMQKLVTEKDKLQKQITNIEHESNVQREKLVIAHTEEKKMLLKEQHQLLSELENLKPRLNMLEQEKKDVTEIIMQKDALLSNLENEISTYKNQIKDAEQNSHMEKNKLVSLHAEEKKILLEDKQQLLSEVENLRSRLNIFEQDKQNITEIVAQKNALLSDLENEISIYKNQIKSVEQNSHMEKNKLAALHAEENKRLLEDQQRLLSELENLKLRLNMLERDKNDITEIIAQKDLLLTSLENEMSSYKNQMKSAEQNSHMEKNKLMNVHAEEKKMLVEEQKRLLSEVENLQSLLNTLEQDKNDIAKTIAQKDALISHLENKVSTYENQNEAIVKKQNTLEETLSTKTETIQNLLTISSGAKQRETKLINDVNRMEKKLNSEIEYSKNLKDKLSKAHTDLQLAQVKNVEMEKNLEKMKTATELQQRENIELQEQLKNLQKEKEEILERQARSENVLIKSTTDQERSREQKSVKRKYDNLFDSYITEINEDGQSNVSTSAEFNDDDNNEPSSPADSRSSQVLNTHTNRTLYSTERESQKEQEAEVTSVGKKFFHSRSAQRRTYSRRQR